MNMEKKKQQQQRAQTNSCHYNKINVFSLLSLKVLQSNLKSNMIME